MSFASRLTHTVHLVRDVPGATDDEYGQPVTVTEIGENFRAAIQPKTAREIALVTQAGAAYTDTTIFCLPRLMTTADKIVHVAASCPVPAAADLPDGTYELSGVRNAAGLGHHLEVDARVIGTGAAAVEGS
jgi:hypothetical protein